MSIGKISKILLDQILLNKRCKIFEEKLKIETSAIFYEFSELFNLSNLNRATLSYIERCFTMVVGSENFLNLSFSSLSKILSSSQLHITSELEIFDAADKWLSHSLKRQTFAKQLLLKVRLHLLSKDCLKIVFENSKSFSKSYECRELINKVSQNKDEFFKKLNVHSTSRYCNQELFRILICGGYDEKLKTTIKSTKQLDVHNLSSVKECPPMIKERVNPKLVYVKGEVFVFGGWVMVGSRVVEEAVRSVEKLMLSSNTWSEVCEMVDSREDFCTCAFMDKVYVFGGDIESGILDSCLKFDTESYKFDEAAKMNEARSWGACVVYEERIVVSGGYDNTWKDTNTVESYNAIANTWTRMPNMIEAKSRHSLVVCKSKLYVIGSETRFCEAFDSYCNNVVAIKRLMYYFFRALPIGSEIFILEDRMGSVETYDKDINKCSRKLCEVTDYLSEFGCIKLPIY